ncbi:rod shape-determining protein MreD [Borreliella andersonii]|uniref:Rod shape-determining protein MreD n=1 Tax=Borrelia andersonii TaxID=42109 RepID=A0ABZ0CFN8_BORAD|nr:rod shape-determining protein MreD [Borreliella andersonii]WNY66137.1 rod shape-determining protein MreD [Borreliella andersonii]
MAAFSTYFIFSAFLGKIFQHYFATYFYFSIDIFLIFLVFNSLNFIFNVGLLSSILYGLLMDYFTGLPLGFFVFGYTIIFYFNNKMKLFMPKNMLSMTIFFILSKAILWFLAIVFYDVVDLKSFNYSIFNLDLVVNLMFINFLYPIQNYFTKSFYSFKEDY